MTIIVTSSAPNNHLTTIEAVKETLGLDMNDETDHALINRLIASASSTIARATDRVLAREGVTEKIPGSGRTKLLLTRTPIVLVSEIREDDEALDEEDINIYDRDVGVLFRENIFTSGEELRSGVEIQRIYSESEQNWAVDYYGGYVLPGWPGLSLDLTVGDVDTVEDKINSVGHGLIKNDQVKLESVGSLPAPLVVDVVYYALPVDADSFQLASQIDGMAIDLTDVGSGDFTLRRCVTLPETLQNAAIETVALLWQRRQRDRMVQSERLGDYSVTYGDPQTSISMGLTKEVIGMLEPFVRYI